MILSPALDHYLSDIVKEYLSHLNLVIWWIIKVFKGKMIKLQKRLPSVGGSVGVSVGGSIDASVSGSVGVPVGVILIQISHV